jgi:hypothetical protein
VRRADRDRVLDLDLGEPVATRHGDRVAQDDGARAFSDHVHWALCLRPLGEPARLAVDRAGVVGERVVAAATARLGREGGDLVELVLAALDRDLEVLELRLHRPEDRPAIDAPVLGAGEQDDRPAGADLMAGRGRRRGARRQDQQCKRAPHRRLLFFCLGFCFETFAFAARLSTPSSRM